MGHIFGIVNEHIGAPGKSHIIGIVKPARMPVQKFIVGKKYKRGSGFGKPESQALVRMTQVYGTHIQRPDIKTVRTDIVIENFRLEILDLYRKARRRHGRSKHIFQGIPFKGASIHIDRGSGILQWFKKRKPDDMVPVAVGEQQRILITALINQAVSESAYARPGIHYYHIVISGAKLNAWCIAAVFDILRPRYGN
jgi:hypothetical protein